jgi:hypothetical protein
MRCEDFLPWLASDDPSQAAQARRHAQACESCQAAAAMLDDVRAELAGDGQLPAHLRQSWMNVADTAQIERPAPAHLTMGRSALWWAGLAASLLAAAAAWALWGGRLPEQARPSIDQVAPQRVQLADGFDERRVGPIEIVTIDRAAEYEHFGGELAALDELFAQVMADAEQRAVEEALERVLVDHQRVFAARGSR